MKEEDIDKVKETFSITRNLIKEISDKLNAYLIVLICHKSVGPEVAYKMNKILRKSVKGDQKLAILIDSFGGDIDTASKITKILNQYSKGYIAIVPFYAKSAATLLALSSEKIIMCKAGELGVTDPMVRDPVTRIWVPASSIREAIRFIEEIKDPLIKLAMADKLPPLLIGAYNVARKVSKQYLEEIFKNYGNKDELIEAFTEKYLSHGYPINGATCKELKLPVELPDPDLEDKIYTLLEYYLDLLSEFEKRETDEKKRGEHLIIQTKDASYIIINDEEITIDL